MARKHRRRSRHRKLIRLCLAICAVLLVLTMFTIGAQLIENFMAVKVQNAGQQVTAHTTKEDAAQVFMNGQWHEKKNVETLLVIGIDDFGAVTGSKSYNNAHQADFMMLVVRNTETGENHVIHLNRDTMTDIPILGVTGQTAGTQRAQLALAYNYGQGQHDSSRNTMDAVSKLLYGIEIDHYITVTMDAVPVMNDWAGGVTVNVMEDMTSVDSMLVPGSEIKLTGEQALAYIRTRKGLDDSTNINRMERQRQFANAWIEAAQTLLQDENAVKQLVMQMSDYHYSDCTAQELAELADVLGTTTEATIHELPGKAVQGDQFMEFHADDAGIQQLVLDVFYKKVN